MEALLNVMRLQAEMAGKQRAPSKFGVVSAYNPADYCAKVRLQPEDLETGWLPVASPWVGNGWGMFCPPTPGDTVEVVFQEDDIECGYIVGRLYTDAARPVNVPSGDFYLIHQSGSYLKFLASGDVQLNTARDLSATVGRDLSATVEGNANLDVTGNINSQAALWTHTGLFTVNGLFTATQGMVVGNSISGGVACRIQGTMNYVSATVTYDASTSITLNAGATITHNGHDIGYLHKHLLIAGSSSQTDVVV